MRVLLVLGPSTGGIARHVADLAAAARRRGHEVRVVGPAHAVMRTGDAGRSWVHPLLAPAVLRHQLAGCELVHAHGVRAGLLTAAALRLTPRGQLPLVVTWHNLPNGSLAARSLTAQRLLAHAADLTLCVSRDLCAHVAGLGGRPVLAPVPGRARVSAAGGRQRIRHELAVADHQPLVLAVARLAHQKGLDVLVQAAARLPLLAQAGAVVAVAGEGPLRAALQMQARRAEVDLRLLGPRDDVGDLLAAADVVVLPSRWEGSPLAAQEALLAGRPLVATDVGGVRELVGDGARLVAAGDASALATALHELLTDSAQAARLAEAGRARALQWAGVDDQLAAVLGHYDELAGMASALSAAGIAVRASP